MVQLAEHKYCTGCGACAFRCPKGCIEMKEDELGSIYPVVNADLCISCHACEKVCPVLSPVLLSTPAKAYAAWSNNNEERLTSASGGIAFEIYKHTIARGYKALGASQSADFSVHHKVASDIQEVRMFKNSKYVFSDAYAVYKDIRDLLRCQEKVVFIGLPCQVAALRKLFRDDKNLILVDLICHGTAPLSYLKQHIADVESRVGQKASVMSFRDPAYYTYTYTFTLYSHDGTRFYAQRTKEGGTYQYGYHRAINYRENCYHCPYAQPNRASDLTLGDYHGLGKLSSVSYSSKNVSVVLVNSARGGQLIQQMISSDDVYFDERPVEEPIRGEKQLRHPSRKSWARLQFEKEIVKNHGDYVKTMRPIIDKDKRLTAIRKVLGLPKRVWHKIIG